MAQAQGKTAKLHRNEVDMTHGPLVKKIMVFAMTLAFSSMLQQFFNAADLAVVGRYAGSREMAAVGSNVPVITLLISLFVGLSVGANVVVANFIGAGRRDRISDAVHTTIFLSMAAGVFLMVLGGAAAKPILHLMGAPDEVLRLAVIYLRIYFCAMPAMFVYNWGSALLRAKGDTSRPFYVLAGAGVLNVLLNLFFVIVLHLHVVGVALATVISNILSAGMILRILMNEPDEFRLRRKDLKIHKQILMDILRIGLPSGIQGTVFSFSNVVIQSAINSLGPDCIAGMAAAVNFEYLSFFLMNAFTQTCVTFTSQNFGARDAARCKRVWRLCMLLGTGLDLLFVFVVVLFRSRLISIFTTEPEVIRFAMVRVKYAFSIHFLCATYEITAGSLRGMNHPVVPTAITLSGTFVLRLFYVLCIFPHYGTADALIMVYPISWILTTIVMNTVYFIIRRREFEKMRTAAA